MNFYSSLSDFNRGEGSVRLTFGQMSNVLEEGMVAGHLIQIFFPQILPQDPDQQCFHPFQQFLQVSIVIGLQSRERFVLRSPFLRGEETNNIFADRQIPGEFVAWHTRFQLGVKISFSLSLSIIF